jgi:hypothetical protein
MWIIGLVLGIPGVLCSLYGMIYLLINEVQNNGFSAIFWIMLITGIIVLFAVAVGIYGIYNTIKHNKNLFF